MTTPTNDPPTLHGAIAEHYASQPAAGPNDRALRSLPLVRDERLERTAAAIAKDPAFAQSLSFGDRRSLAVYAESRQAHAAAFRWNSGLELQLAQRDAGEKLTTESERAVTAYADARANAESHGLLEAARKRANGGS